MEIGVTIDDQSYTGKSIQEIVDKNSINAKECRESEHYKRKSGIQGSCLAGWCN